MSSYSVVLTCNKLPENWVDNSRNGDVPSIEEAERMAQFKKLLDSPGDKLSCINGPQKRFPVIFLHKDPGPEQLMARGSIRKSRDEFPDPEIVIPRVADFFRDALSGKKSPKKIVSSLPSIPESPSDDPPLWPLEDEEPVIEPRPQGEYQQLRVEELD
jgi:hypothetical protein